MRKKRGGVENRTNLFFCHQALLLCAITFVLYPLLLGLCIQLVVVVPLSQRVDTWPILKSWHCWVIGLFVLKLQHQGIMACQFWGGGGTTGIV